MSGLEVGRARGAGQRGRRRQSVGAEQWLRQVAGADDVVGPDVTAPQSSAWPVPSRRRPVSMAARTCPGRPLGPAPGCCHADGRLVSTAVGLAALSSGKVAWVALLW